MANKNRHLIARYILKARKGAPTHIKGWMDDDANVQWDETVVITKGLRSKALCEAQVILDLDDKLIVKNWKSNEDIEFTFERLYQYYRKHYADYIDRFMQLTS